MLEAGADRRAGETATARPLELAVIVPVIDECDAIEPMFRALTAVLTGIEWELLFVDDGSTDGTGDAIAALALTHRHVHGIYRFGRRGLSSAVIEGAMATSAPIVAVIDGDMQHDEAALPALYRAVADGADLAVGTRYAEGGSVGDWAGARKHGSAVATRLARLVLRAELSDPMSGFFAIRRSVIVALLPRLSGIGFKILLDIVASSPAKLAIAEIPYCFRGRAAGASKMDTKTILEYLVLLVDKTLGRVLPTRLILFLMVGAIGVIVHLGTLRAYLAFDPGSFATAQTVAVLTAIAFNFTLNNAITYRDRHLSGFAFWRGLASFYLICGAGAVANIGVGTLVFRSDTSWWLAGIAGATIGAVWNYAASSLLTWKKA